MVSPPRSEVGSRGTVCSTRSQWRRCLPSSTEIKSKARELGFDRVGIAPLGPFPEAQFYSKWLDSGYAGDMQYLERQKPAKLAPTYLLQDVKPIIVCAMNYTPPRPYTQVFQLRTWNSRYA